MFTLFRFGIFRVSLDRYCLRRTSHPSVAIATALSAAKLARTRYDPGIERILVLDIGTSGLRAAVVSEDARIIDVNYAACPPSLPAPGLVEFDPVKLAATAVELARSVLARSGPVKCVGITNQRASTVVWDRSTGEPVAPGIGWQDLRTVARCLELQASGVRLTPNASATKLSHLLDLERARAGLTGLQSGDLCFGTLDTWIAWVLAGGPVPGVNSPNFEQSRGGAVHVTDWTNAAVTGLVSTATPGWDLDLLSVLDVPLAVMPKIVDSAGIVGEARALGTSAPIASLVGDQQASLVGQGCIHEGMAKITFGTGGMLDQCVGTRPPESVASNEWGPNGTIPIIAWTRDGQLTWGIEAMMISAGAAVDWLCDGLGILASPADSQSAAASCNDSAGVWFVPALIGLGTPVWDFGARGAFFGLTRGSTAAHLARAVLEGVAHRGADLVDAAEADSHLAIDTIRVDGGMSANPVFLQALADATGRCVEVSPVTEATTLGAAYLAGVACGVWRDEEQTARLWSPGVVIEPDTSPGAPQHREEARANWFKARKAAEGTIPELSALHF
ncbi:MAG: FGGY family carbohydrate kinase [Acidimicrobiales bacterium]